MKVKNYLLLLTVAGVAIIAGCHKKTVENENSGYLEEEAVVIEKVHLSKLLTHGECEKVSKSTNFSDNGVVDFSIPIEINVPDVRVLILRCKHGKFVIRSDDTNLDYSDNFSRLEIGRKVIIGYRSVYKNYYDNYKLTRSRLIGYKYLRVTEK